MAQQERPVITLNPAVRGIQPVMLFDKMFVRVYQWRRKDFGKDSLAYVGLAVHFFAGYTGELLAVSPVGKKRHGADCADTLQCRPAGNTLFLFQFRNLQIIRACGLALFFALPKF